MVSKVDPDYMTLMQVALRIRERYSKARDLVLTGRIEGGAMIDGRLRVPRVEVEKFLKTHHKKEKST